MKSVNQLCIVILVNYRHPDSLIAQGYYVMLFK